ncbi:unnamed protein product [Owenia fusiformis]|uniref:Uncharacterized protein n=1 Tax=Owenia fusiformis TaxID=6347 RepID=A0A8J1YBE4_OWEFU|nr:unnamed protein product [Owenia fusiformis]
MAASQLSLKPYLTKSSKRPIHNIELTGPFPKPKDYDTLKGYKIPTSTSDGVERLTEFVKYIASKVNVKNRYTPEQLNEHTEYVEKFVKELCIGFGMHSPKDDLSNKGKPNPILQSSNIIRRGSSYEETKILSPSEYDYIPIFAWSFDAAVNVEEVGEMCNRAGQGYGFINIQHGELHQLFSQLRLHLVENQPGMSGSIDRSPQISSLETISALGTIPQSLPGSSKMATTFLAILHLVIELQQSFAQHGLEENQPGMSGSINRLPQISSPDGTIPQSQPVSSKLTTFFLETLHFAIQHYLSDSDKYEYIGDKNHHDDPESPYPLGTISLHEGSHGTSVWLRIGAPMCTTDIDLSFGVENMSDTQRRCVMVGRYLVDCDKCNNRFTHWTESLVHAGLQDDTNTHTLSTNHHYLFLTFKYIKHLIETNFKVKTISSSYSYKMLLHHHQRGCQNENVGQCLEDIVDQFLPHEKQCIDGIETNIYNYNHLKVPDINYPKRMIKLNINADECAALLWIMQHVKHTTDTSWWDMLLQEDLKPDDIKEGDMIHSLLDTLQQVNNFLRNRDLKKGSVLEVQWLHEDNTKTVYRWIKEWDTD